MSNEDTGVFSPMMITLAKIGNRVARTNEIHHALGDQYTLTMHIVPRVDRDGPFCACAVGVSGRDDADVDFRVSSSGSLSGDVDELNTLLDRAEELLSEKRAAAERVLKQLEGLVLR